MFRSAGLENADASAQQKSDAPKPVSDASRRVPPVNPRRVRGGLRLRPQDEQATPHWITERIRRLAEAAADPAILAEALDYARLGQTRRLEVEDGVAVASVQGRMSRPYTVTLKLRHFSAVERDTIVDAMAEQAIYSAKLLAREVPTNIEDLFAPLGFKLFPSEPDEIETSCTCREPKPWCKHAVCAAVLLSLRLGREPLLIFELRGHSVDHFIAMLSDRRALSSQGPGPAIVYQPQIPGVVEGAGLPLGADLERFWEGGPELTGIDAPVSEPEVSHVLLRRLGPSPFTESRFPLVGLLATCYELVSEHARREAEGAEESEDGEADAD